MKNFRFLKIIALISSLLAFNVSAELVVVVNASKNITSLPQSELARLFMGKSSSFEAINQVYATAAYDEFCQAYLGKDAAKMKAYWSKQMFMGKSTPPKAFGTDAEVIAHISANPNAIGYVDSASVADGVKVISIE